MKISGNKKSTIQLQEDKQEDTKELSYQSSQITCVGINLRNSTLVDITPDQQIKQGMLFKLRPRMTEDRIVAELKIKTQNLISEDPYLAQQLEFSIVGIFTCGATVTKQERIDFAKFYTLPILYPYAREYASDVFRRTGFPCEPLPVINAQKTIEDLEKNNLLHVIE